MVKRIFAKGNEVYIRLSHENYSRETEEVKLTKEICLYFTCMGVVPACALVVGTVIGHHEGAGNPGPL